MGFKLRRMRKEERLKSVLFNEGKHTFSRSYDDNKSTATQPMAENYIEKIVFSSSIFYPNAKLYAYRMKTNEKVPEFIFFRISPKDKSTECNAL